MNFWEFKEDHSRGYYLPVSDKAARDQGRRFVRGLFYLIGGLIRLAWAIMSGFGFLLVRAGGWLWRRSKK